MIEFVLSDPCADASIVTITASSQSQEIIQPVYGGGATIWTYVPAVVTPSQCSTTKSCHRQEPEGGYDCLEIGNDDTIDYALTLENYTSDDPAEQIKPAKYFFTYRECVTNSPTKCIDVIV